MQNLLSIGVYALPIVILVAIMFYVFSLRRIVPTNVVHIVQRGKQTVSYGVGKTSNVYYEFPSWLPLLGVVVRELPVSNFGVDLPNYSAYDKDRVPFEVDIKAFFHIADTNKAAEKVESFADLLAQLKNVVQGAVRSILAKEPLEKIMEERSLFGKLFTEAVKDDLMSWGVEPIKSIELMDVRDTAESKVIHQIMAKRISAIDMESRTAVANNTKMALQAELESQKEVSIKKADTDRISAEAKAQSEQAIGIAQAESAKKQGIAEQQTFMEISEAKQLAAEKEMTVLRTQQIKQAEIDKDKALIEADLGKQQVQIDADAAKYETMTAAQANLESKKLESEGIKLVGAAQGESIKAKGLAEAESKQAMELATTTAQTTLAKEIGNNKEYQEYLIKIREIEITGEVNKTQYTSLSTALRDADLKLIVNSGDVNSGLKSFSDILTSSKGGSAIGNMLEGMKNTTEGAALANIIGNAFRKDS